LPADHFTALPLRNSLDAPSARKLARLVRDRRIEIVHAHMARDYPLAAYAARQNPGARFVITRHVLFPLGRLHSIALANVSRVIAVSAAVANALRDQKVIPADRVTVVPNGIDVERFATAKAQIDRQEFRRRWRLGEECQLIGTVGELKALKGHEEF